MNLKLTTSIAKTHLLSRKKQSSIAALGVTFGIAMFIAMTAFMTGVNHLLEETMLSASPHIHIYNDIKTERPSIVEELFLEKKIIIHHQRPKSEKKNLRNASQIIHRLQEDKRVFGVSPSVSSQVFYSYGNLQLSGFVSGVNIEDEDRLFSLNTKMKEGSIEDLMMNSNAVLMGAGLAKKLNVHKGDRINITTPSGEIFTLNIVGIFQIGIGQIDDVRSYANIGTVQRILQKDKNYITDINLKLKDLDQSKKIAAEYAKTFNYKAEDWETANATILISFTLRNVITGATVITILLVAGFGIYNIMNMTIYEKMKDIAILKATGFTSKDVMLIFLTQSLIIGLIGGILGLCLGFLMSLGIEKIPFNTGGFLAIDHMPVNFAIKFYIYGISFGLITTFVAGFFPSKKAGRIDPVDIIRG